MLHPVFISYDQKMKKNEKNMNCGSQVMMNYIYEVKLSFSYILKVLKREQIYFL